jgi:ATP-dependent helicase/nuclease subunit A
MQALKNNSEVTQKLKRQPTPSQEKAMDLSRHLAIIANAGSGKTSVLVDRYIKILEQAEGVTPRNIVAITFTKAAASELRAKISDKLNERIEELSEDASLDSIAILERLMNARDTLSSAYISTIHAFASRILRAYPIESNLDAAFTLHTGAEEQVSIEDAIMTEFTSVLKTAYGDAPTAESSLVLNAFRTLGRRCMKDIVAAMLGKRSRVQHLDQVLTERTDQEILDSWFSTLLDLVREPVRQQLDRLQRLLVVKVNKGNVAQAQSLLAQLDFDAQTLLTVFVRVVALIFGKGGGKLNGKSINHNPGSEYDIDLIREINLRQPIFFPTAAGLCDRTLFDESHLEYLTLLRGIFTIFHKVDQNYIEFKTNHSLLDNDDLIEKLELLLQRPEVANDLSRRFRFIMIDEYQDTDETQYKIAKSLTKNFGKENVLTIVGDPKQSIYRFRNAESAIFFDTIEAILRQQLPESRVHELDTLSESEREQLGKITLAESFRMAERPLAFINKVFAEIMLPSESLIAADEVPYQPLVAARKTILQGSVEWLLHTKPSGPRSNSASSSEQEDDAEEDDDESIGDGSEHCEMALIAEKIQEIIENPEHRYDIETKAGIIPPSYGDIAILIRSRTHLNQLERSLRLRNIPFIVSSGVGYYTQQEVIDVTCYLRFLLQPMDDVSLLGVLRSPFFSISDTALYQLAYRTRNQKSESTKARASFWNRLQTYITSEVDLGPEGERLQRALSQLERNLLLAGRAPTATLIERIYRETGILATYNVLDSSPQRSANLEKLLTLARESDASGFTTIYDFVERINFLTLQKDKEAQATVSSTNVVEIMTIHGSKGLEFPIIFVTDLGAQLGGENHNSIDKHYGLSFKFKDGRKDDPVILKFIKERDKANDRAESKRLLYVALTRAKDHLFLSGSLKENVQGVVTAEKSSFLNSLILDEWENLKSIETAGIGFVGGFDRYDAETQLVTNQSAIFTMPVTRKQQRALPEELVPIAQEREEVWPSYLAPIIPPAASDRFSPTQLLTYRQCPTKHYLKFVLGLPEEPKLAQDYEVEVDAERIRGSLLGEIIHRILEKVDDLSHEGKLDETRFVKALDETCLSYGVSSEAEMTKYRDRARRDVGRFITSDYGNEVLRAEKHFTELEVQTLLGDRNRLFGILDRLYKDSDGVWHILDYKTEWHDKSRHQLKTDQYAFQLKVYAFMISLLYPEAETIRATILYTQTGEQENYSFDRSSLASIQEECETIMGSIHRDSEIKDLRQLTRNLEHCSECSFFNKAANRCIVLV